MDTDLNRGQGRNRITDTRIFSRQRGVLEVFKSPLAALANPDPRPTKAQLRHTKSELDTFVARY